MRPPCPARPASTKQLRMGNPARNAQRSSSRYCCHIGAASCEVGTGLRSAPVARSHTQWIAPKDKSCCFTDHCICILRHSCAKKRRRHARRDLGPRVYVRGKKSSTGALCFFCAKTHLRAIYAQNLVHAVGSAETVPHPGALLRPFALLGTQWRVLLQLRCLILCPGVSLCVREVFRGIKTGAVVIRVNPTARRVR